MGGMLDTISDNVMIFNLSLGILQLLMVNSYILISFMLMALNLMYLALHNSLIHHDGIKVQGNSFHNLYRFVVNNNILFYGTIYIVFVLIVQKL